MRRKVCVPVVETRSHGPSRLSRQSVFWFIAAVIYPLSYGVNHLKRELWFDEAYTVGNFASQPMREIITSYPVPNNHIFFTLLLRPFWLFMQTEASMRMLSLLCMLGTLLVAYRLLLTHFGLLEAICGTMCLGCNRVFLNYAMQLRGYTVSMLLMVLLLECLFSRQSIEGRKRRVRIIIIGALFVWTIPTNLLFLISSGLIDAALTGRESRSAIRGLKAGGIWAIAWIAGVMLYFPVWDQVRLAAAGIPFQFPVWLHLAQGFVADVVHGQWWLLPCLWFWPGDSRSSGMQFRRLTLPVVSLGLLVLPLLLTACCQLSPFARNFVPAVPGLCLLIGASVATMVRTAYRACIPECNHQIQMLTAAAVILLACSWHIYTFPGQLHQRHLHGQPETLYYAPVTQDFKPSRIPQLLFETAVSRHYACLFTDREQSNLGYYMSQTDTPYLYLQAQNNPDQRVHVFLVGAGPIEFEQISRNSLVSAEWLKSLPLLEDDGYFQIYYGVLDKFPEAAAAASRDFSH